MTSTPEGAYMLLLAGNGTAYLYDASVDDFVTAKQVVSPPIVGYYGPVAAGPNGQYYLVNDQVLNSALTSIAGGTGIGPINGGGGLPTPGGPTVTTTTRPVAAVAAVGAQSYARFSLPIRANATAVPTDAGVIDTIDPTSQRTLNSFNTLEGPLTAAIGAQRVNVSGRMMTVDAAGTTAYVLTASGLSILPLNAVAAANVPQLGSTPVVNMANFTPSMAPGGLISVMGRNLAPDATGTGSPLPTVLGGVCVTLNNIPLSLLATSPGQINAQIPPTLAAGRYPLVVRSIANQTASAAATVTVSRYAPAIFLDPDGPKIYHKNGTRVDKAHPATRDEALTIYATGLGVTTGGRVTAGVPAPSSPLAVSTPVQLYFGNPTILGTVVIVNWSGLVPGMIGVYRVDCQIPGYHINGDALPVTLKIGGASTPTTGSGVAVVYVR
jgi:uncharacterized protein (TIGR03437 family)